MFGLSIPWMVFITVFIAMITNNRRTEDALMTAGFFSWAISMMIRLLGWINNESVIMFTIIMAFSIGYSWLKGGTYE